MANFYYQNEWKTCYVPPEVLQRIDEEAKNACVPRNKLVTWIISEYAPIGCDYFGFDDGRKEKIKENLAKCKTKGKVQFNVGLTPIKWDMLKSHAKSLGISRSMFVCATLITAIEDDLAAVREIIAAHKTKNAPA